MEQATDKRNNIYKSQKHYVEWKKPDTRDNVLYDTLYIKFWEKQKYSEIKWLVDAGNQEEEEIDCKGHNLWRK